MPRLGLVGTLLVLLLSAIAPLPAHALTNVCGGAAPFTDNCTTSILPECSTSACTANATISQPPRFFSGVVKVSVDGSLSGQHYEDTCVYVVGRTTHPCLAQAELWSFDLAVCTAEVTGVGPWQLLCSTP